MKRQFCHVGVLSLICSACVKVVAADSNPLSFRELAGVYYFGDGTGVNCTLTLAERGTFAFQWRGCLGTYDDNEGQAGIRDGILRIVPKKPNVREGFRGTPTEFFPIRWDDRLYLVPTNEIVEFCCEVNQGGEPRHGNWGQFYLRQNDWTKQATGSPVVPERWTKFLLGKPATGKITQLINKREAWLDVGAKEGILEGMLLIARDHGKLMFSKVRVKTVEKDRCRIKCEWKDSELAVGQTVSSLFHE